jgi:ornithine cyclodeaminase/alanine dehydrogenase
MGAKIFGIGTKRMVNYVIVLVEQDSGLIAGFVDGGAVTAIRTAATSAMAIDRLSKPGPLRVGMLGSGEEAQAHLAALASIRTIESLAVYSPTRARREAFASQHATKLATSAVAVDSREAAARDCDVLIAAARSHDETPIVTADMVEPGKLIVSIGSTLPEQREMDISVVASADLIVCDAVEEVANETGDMLAARDAGVVFMPKMISLNALMIGDHNERVSQARNIVFKSVGSALQDIVIAELAYHETVESGQTAELPLRFHTKHA